MKINNSLKLCSEGNIFEVINCSFRSNCDHSEEKCLCRVDLKYAKGIEKKIGVKAVLNLNELRYAEFSVKDIFFATENGEDWFVEIYPKRNWNEKDLIDDSQYSLQ